MGNPCEPLTPRQELIAELEGLGYDLFPGVRKDWADWRERMSDEQLRSAIDSLKEHYSEPQDLPEGEGCDPVPEMPDASEIAEALGEALAAGDAYTAAHPDEPATILDEAGERWHAAWVRLRALNDQINQALEAFRT